MNTISKYFDVVEKELAKYPVSWQRNYYQNKKTLKILYKDVAIKTVTATYDNEKNLITIYGSNIDSLDHELFHMAFRDGKKVNQEILPDLSIFYGNGVSFKESERNIFHLKSVTEGLVEYLTRKYRGSMGHAIEYFFMDLLISIYGEEILEYAFLNDPLGILKDRRFYDFDTFAISLDNYYISVQEFQIALYLIDNLKKIMKEDENARKEFSNIIGKNIELFNESIRLTFECIIKEYRVCKNPKIKREVFVKKLSELLTNPAYKIAFAMEEEKFGLKKSLQKSIDKLK